MKLSLRSSLLIAFVLAACGQDVNTLSSDAKYPPLAQQAQIQGEVTVLLATGPDGAMETVKKGHRLLVAGIEPDAGHWKEWAGMGIEQVTYVFKIAEPVFVTTKVQVPRSKLVALIPWVKKTRNEEHTEQVKRLPAMGLRELQLSGKTLRITISVDPTLFQPSSADRLTS